MVTKREELLQDLLEPLVEEQGYELVHIEYKKEGADWYLRLFIDHEQGVGLGECQQVSQVVSRKLDEEDPIPISFILEVSSPGVERPLKKKKDFERFKGRLIQVRSFAPINGQKDFRGRLEDFQDDNIELEVDGDFISIPFEAISKAHLLVEF